MSFLDVRFGKSISRKLKERAKAERPIVSES